VQPGDFIHVIGDAHVYLNHVTPLREQLTREPRAFPSLRIKRDVADIDDFKYEDFEVVGYKPHKTIKMKMAV
jgi:thymidylate synthase